MSREDNVAVFEDTKKACNTNKMLVEAVKNSIKNQEVILEGDSYAVVNNEELSPQEELVQDIVSILHVFSCRLYGLRKYKKQIERDEEIAKELQDGNEPYGRTESQNQLLAMTNITEESARALQLWKKMKEAE